MKTFGRRTIFANYTEKQLLEGTQEQREAKVLDIIINSVALFQQNQEESEYLQN